MNLIYRNMLRWKFSLLFLLTTLCSVAQDKDTLDYPDVASVELFGDSGFYYRMIGWYDKAKTQKAFVLNFMNGKQNGITKIYYPEGNTSTLAIFGNGVLDGEVTHYDHNGKIILKGKYREGVKHGYWALIAEDCYGRYKHGKKHGRWKCGCHGKNCQIIRYKHGKEISRREK